MLVTFLRMKINCREEEFIWAPGLRRGGLPHGREGKAADPIAFGQEGVNKH